MDGLRVNKRLANFVFLVNYSFNIYLLDPPIKKYISYLLVINIKMPYNLNNAIMLQNQTILVIKEHL